MGKRRPLSFLLLLTVLLAGIGAGMLVQAKVQVVRYQTARDVNTLVTELARTTAERDRLLEHLADVESSDCIPIMVWACPAKGGEQE